MHRRVRAVVVALFVVGAALVGVGLADPFRADPPAPRVDTGDSPAEMASDALLATRGADHTVEWYVGNATELRGPMSRSFVENTDRQVYGVGFQTERRFVTYAEEAVSWRGPAGSLERSGWGGWDEYNTFVRSVAPLERPDADVRVAAANDSVVVLRVHDTDAAYAVAYDEPNVTETADGRRADLNATLTLVVSRDDGRLDRAAMRISRDERNEAGREVSRFVFRYSDWGDTDVHRPGGAGYTLAEFLFDATNYPTD